MTRTTPEVAPLSRKFGITPADSNIPDADYEIYTDGSRIENETGFAVCMLKDEINIQNYLFKLNTFNSVFQAELAAIEFAATGLSKRK
ncbi:hypothetical protein AVEN_7836-1 [Araneus ventricosus]|uniref:RNase H type-1 domain-containing protein n=1 Tax=Araneus ventricosus TaxID=182803 RepID=A0A4Y2EZX7_ARAVE|nr:hypothetical protein AVEN_7836-1 [Araneus ventricosus]